MLADKLIPADGSEIVVVSSPIVTSKAPIFPNESSTRDIFLLASVFAPVTKVPLRETSISESIIFIIPNLFFDIEPDSNVNLPLGIDNKNSGFCKLGSNFSTINSESPSNVRIELSMKDIVILEFGLILTTWFTKIWSNSFN